MPPYVGYAMKEADVLEKYQEGLLLTKKESYCIDQYCRSTILCFVKDGIPQQYTMRLVKIRAMYDYSYRTQCLCSSKWYRRSRFFDAILEAWYRFRLDEREYMKIVGDLIYEWEGKSKISNFRVIEGKREAK